MDAGLDSTLLQQFSGARQELLSYLSRLVIRPHIADDLLQTVYLRCLEAKERLPSTSEGMRAWMFKVASNLAIDEVRRHASWRETMMGDLREVAVASDAFVARSKALAGTPETKAIAREHLVACMACTLRNLPERKAAAVLLKEVHGFDLADTAQILDASPTQVKNWLQEGRAVLNERYGQTCALVVKAGVCYQCVELDGFFGSNQGAPMPEGSGLEARFAIASEQRQQPWGAWHGIMWDLIDEVR